MTLSEVVGRPATPATSTGRISGIDAARAVAMLGMVIAHYAWPVPGEDGLDRVVRVTNGRAMPLFVLLGGVGVSILVERASRPDRTLLLRAAMLYPLGLLLQELTTFIAIILQSYALFFALAPLFRRLPTRALLAVAAVVAVVGSWTHQVVGPRLPGFSGPGDLVTDPATAVWELVFNGHYPFFPVGSFFLLGMVIGRLDLRSTRVAGWLAGVGMAVGVGTVLVAGRLFDAVDGDESVLGDSEGEFLWARLLDTTGHSEMLAWVISAAGTSVGVLGLALLITPRAPLLLAPMLALGRLALSFYVFQAVLVRFTPHPNTTPLDEEVVTALVIYTGFAAFALLWRLRFRDGPMEWLLRLGSSTRSI